MNFNSYYLSVLGDIDLNEVKSSVTKISESDVNYINGTGILLCTFTSAATTNEIKEYLISYNYNFLIFKLKEGDYAANFENEQLYSHLFSNQNEKINDVLTNNIIKKINDDNLISRLEKINNMNDDDKIELLDSILDKGKEFWTEDDKKIIDKIRNSK